MNKHREQHARAGLCRIEFNKLIKKVTSGQIHSLEFIEVPVKKKAAKKVEPKVEIDVDKDEDNKSEEG